MNRVIVAPDNLLIYASREFSLTERSYLDARVHLGAVLVPGDVDPKWCRVTRQMYLGPSGLLPFQLALPAYTRDDGWFSLESGRVDHATYTLPPFFTTGWVNPHPKSDTYQIAVGIRVVDAGTLKGHKVSIQPAHISITVTPDG